MKQGESEAVEEGNTLPLTEPEGFIIVFAIAYHLTLS
jgi:hypothetical protein